MLPFNLRFEKKSKFKKKATILFYCIWCDIVDGIIFIDLLLTVEKFKLSFSFRILTLVLVK